MREDRLALYDGRIWGQIPNTNTYELKYKKPADFVTSMVTVNDTTFLLRQLKTMEPMFESRHQNQLPKVSYNDDWVEYADCYFCPKLFLVTKTLPREIACYKKWGEISHEMLRENSETMIPKRSLEILENSYPEEIEWKRVASIMFKNWHVIKRHRTPILCLIGEPASGKTSLMDAMSETGAEHFQMKTCKDGRFSLANLPGKHIMLSDEGIGLPDTEELLKLTDGNATFTPPRKGKKAEEVWSNLTIVVASNDDILEERIEEERRKEDKKRVGDKARVVQELLLDKTITRIEEDGDAREQQQIQLSKARTARAERGMAPTLAAAPRGGQPTIGQPVAMVQTPVQRQPQQVAPRYGREEKYRALATRLDKVYFRALPIVDDDGKEAVVAEAPKLLPWVARIANGGELKFLDGEAEVRRLYAEHKARHKDWYENM